MNENLIVIQEKDHLVKYLSVFDQYNNKIFDDKFVGTRHLVVKGVEENLLTNDGIKMCVPFMDDGLFFIRAYY